MRKARVRQLLSRALRWIEEDKPSQAVFPLAEAAALMAKETGMVRGSWSADLRRRDGGGSYTLSIDLANMTAYL